MSEKSAPDFMEAEFLIPAQRMVDEGRPADALRYLELARIQFARSPELLDMLVTIARLQNDHTRIRRYLETIVFVELSRGNPDAQRICNSILDLKDLAKQIGQRQRMGKFCTKLMADFPHVKKHLTYVAHEFIKSERLRKYAWRCFAAVLALDPHDRYALCGLAMIYRQRKQFDRAKPLLEEALEMDRNNVIIMTILGFVELELGNFARAQKIAEEALEHEPTNRVARYLFIKTLCLQGQRDAARPLIIEELQKPNPERPYIYMFALITDPSDPVWMAFEQHLSEFQRNLAHRIRSEHSLHPAEEHEEGGSHFHQNVLWDRCHAMLPINAIAARGVVEEEDEEE